jgi:hypothetical protein
MNITGTATGGAVQIRLAFLEPPMEIDNTRGSGIKISTSPGFAAAATEIVSLGPREINGRCAGFLTISLAPGAAPPEGEFIRIEGIRGRVDRTRAIVPGTDLYANLQSANDPTATSFFPDSVRVATSLDALDLRLVELGASLQIGVTEGFARAFADLDAGDDASPANDRIRTGANPQGAPAHSTEVLIRN